MYNIYMVTDMDIAIYDPGLPQIDAPLFNA